MSDNPRMPGHPSDMNSSRSSEGSNNSGSQNSGPAPVSYQREAAAAPNHQARNIILGAIATVVTSTLIYYLTVFQNRKSEGASHLEVKEATVEAWKSYKAYENTYTGNMLSFEKSYKENGSLEGYVQGMNTESKKFVADLTDLSTTDNLDKDLVKAFKRRLENETSTVEKAAAYYATINKVLSANTTPRKKKEEFVAEEMRWSQYIKGAFERSINDVQEIAKILGERYGQTFSLSDFLNVQLQPQRQKTYDSVISVLNKIEIDDNGNIVQKNIATNLQAKDVEGTWNVDGDVVALQKNGNLAWTMQEEGKKATGTWKIVDSKIVIEATIGGSNEKLNYTFSVSNLTSSSFTISQSEPPYQQYDVTRIIVN